MGYAGKFDQVYDSSSFPEWEAYALNADRDLELRATVTGGRHAVGVSFDRRSAMPEGILQRMTDAGDGASEEGLIVAREYIEAMRSGCAGIYIVPTLGRYKRVAQLVAELKSGRSGR